MILVTGFGPFGDILENPSDRLARAVHGARIGGETVVGLTLPVAYERGIALALATARSADCAAVIGLGVAARRSRVEVEQIGRNRAGGTPDVDGVTLCVLDAAGPELVSSSAHAVGLAAALDAGLSEHAGEYVCNAWIYRMVRALPNTPVVFVHVPLSGLPPARFLAGLSRWLDPAR